MAVLAIYDDASEALHATLYGCSFHVGAYKPGVELIDHNSIKSHYRSNINMTLMLLGGTLSDLIIFIGNITNNSELVDKATKTHKNIIETIENTISS